MIEAATGVSVPLIAIILILQLVLPAISRRLATAPRGSVAGANGGANGGKAVMQHRIGEIDQRTEEMGSVLRTLVPTLTQLSASVRANTRAVEKLTTRMEK